MKLIRLFQILFVTVALPLVTFGCIGQTAQPTQTPQPQEKKIAEATFSVRESDLDVDTNIDVLITDRLVINASGKIWAGVVATGENGPQGWNNIDPDPKFPLPGTHPYSLLGKVGTKYFFIGDGSQVDHPINNGRLFLRTNDDSPGNGSGAFTVSIQVWRK